MTNRQPGVPDYVREQLRTEQEAAALDEIRKRMIAEAAEVSYQLEIVHQDTVRDEVSRLVPIIEKTCWVYGPHNDSAMVGSGGNSGKYVPVFRLAKLLHEYHSVLLYNVAVQGWYNRLRNACKPSRTKAALWSIVVQQPGGSHGYGGAVGRRPAAAIRLEDIEEVLLEALK